MHIKWIIPFIMKWWFCQPFENFILWLNQMSAGDSKWLIKRAAILDQSPNFDKGMPLELQHDRGRRTNCQTKVFIWEIKFPKKLLNLVTAVTTNTRTQSFFSEQNLRFGGRQSTVTMVFTRWPREDSLPVSRALGESRQHLRTFARKSSN